MQFLIIALIFCSVVAVVLAVANLTGRRPAQRRLARLADGSSAQVTVEKGSVLQDEGRGWLVRLMAPFAGQAARKDSPSLEPLRKRLVQAGYRRESAVVVYQGSRIFLALLLPALALASPLAWSLDELRLMALLLAATGAGVFIPSYWIDRKRAARQKAMIIGLPDALDLMVVCVEAGLGINASLARVAQEFSRSNPILSSEFELVTLETRAGKSTTESLRGLAERTGVIEVSALVAMLVQTERFGTNVADTLRVHADGLRTQRLLRAEEMAAKAPLKMLFPTAIIFIATLIVTIGPGMVQLFAFFQESR